MKNRKGENLTIWNLPAHWLEDYHHRIKAGIPSDLAVAADQLSQVTGASEMKTAVVVDTPKAAKALNQILGEGHRAFAVRQPRTGWRCARIIVLATMTQEGFSEWFSDFRNCLAPDGDIKYL